MVKKEECIVRSPKVHGHAFVNLRIHLVTVILIVLDSLWLVGWIITIGASIENMDSYDSNAAFTALAAPHTAIIPALFTVAVSFRRAIRENYKDEDAVAQLDFGWLLSPLLAVPFDAALTRMLFRTDKTNALTWGLACYGMCVSVATSVFMFFVFYEISQVTRSALFESIKEGWNFFVDGLKSCVWESYFTEVRERRRSKMEDESGAQGNKLTF